jgi:hypothetical protein
LIIFKPHYILNPGMQMSFSAVFLLIYFNLDSNIKLLDNKITNTLENKVNPRLISILSTLNKGFSAVLIPHLAIFPITIFYFQSFTTYSIIANLLAIPLISIIMYLLLIYFFLKLFHVEHFLYLLKICLKILIEMIIKISSIFSDLPWNFFTTHQISHFAFGTMIFGIMFLGVFQTKIRFYGLLIYAFGLILCFQKNTENIILVSTPKKAEIFFQINGEFCSFNSKYDKYIGNRIQKMNNQKYIPIVSVADFNDSYINFLNCSTWNNFYSAIKIKKEKAFYSIFCKNNVMKVTTMHQLIGNRPWNTNIS